MTDYASSADADKGGVELRLASAADIDLINAMTARSIEALHVDDYDARVRQLSIQLLYGVDSQLIKDRSYFVAELAGRIVGAGGWSWRETLYGAHDDTAVAGEPLDPAHDPARIRAFYIDPDHARAGVGRELLAASEAAAQQAGFTWATLTSTLTAIPFYARHGYVEGDELHIPLPDGLALELRHMSKTFPSKEEAQ